MAAKLPELAAQLPEARLARIIEGALLASETPLSPRQLADLFAAQERPSPQALKAALARLRADCESRACRLEQVAGGYRLRLRDELEPYLERMRRERPPRYSRALMETCAAIAYHQPLSRGDIEELRGVSLSPGILRTLLEREWVHVVGCRETPGRPALYATTPRFLADLGLLALSELPPLPALASGDGDECPATVSAGDMPAMADAAAVRTERLALAVGDGLSVAEALNEPIPIAEPGQPESVPGDAPTADAPTAVEAELPDWPVPIAEAEPPPPASPLAVADAECAVDAEDGRAVAVAGDADALPLVPMPLPIDSEAPGIAP